MSHDTHKSPKAPNDYYIDDLIRQSKLDHPPVTHDKLLALEELDSFEGYDPRGVIDIVGVLGGLKPTAIVARPNDEPSVIKLEDLMQRLGLAYAGIDDLEQARSFAVSYYPELASILAELSPRLRDPQGFDERAHRQAGKLLGYPEKSIEHFIARSKHDIQTGKRTPIIDKRTQGIDPEMMPFVDIILDSESAREEAKRYGEPLRRLVEVMAPSTYNSAVAKAAMRYQAS